MIRNNLFVLGVALVFGATATAFPPLPRPAEEQKKEAPKADPKSPEVEDVDVQKTAERIAENAQKAGDRLKEKDPGEDTRKIQDEIIKDIDSLIKKAQQPPPPPMSSDMPPPMMPPPKSDMPPPKSDMPMPKSGMSGGSPMPMGGMPMGGMPMPKSGMGGGSGSEKKEGGRRPRRERKDRGEGPMGMNEPMPMPREAGKDPPMPAKIDPKEGPMPMGGAKDKPDGGDKFGKASPKRENDKLAELYKDVWGHLPDRMRQEMDLYYREQFMPRYSELLRRYYASLAEQKKKGDDR